MTIAVDFDGTIVEHDYPRIGKEKPFAIDTLKALSAQGYKLILWTAREGKLLDEAVTWCRERGQEFYAVNDTQPAGSLFANRRTSAKIVADMYIDDRNFGGLPDWGEIYERIVSGKEGRPAHKKKKRFRLFSRR